ncbi:MAG: DUF4304 domain-containing protein [Planctomycetes bacterium]|nr:DUF4304 domain-containing protein [Planctomycetota bacterium]
MGSSPAPYLWTFDKPSDDFVAGFVRLSVSVYQWIPKSSGKGLKRSKSIRVHGYTAEAQRLYDKANELCNRLNKEGARAESPPPWLQKQYSVPKPEGLELGRFSDQLKGSLVRSIRLKVMKECLLPEGFVKGKGGTYVRKCGNQIHLIDFQAMTFGYEYAVNVCLHFDFVIPLFHRREIELDEFDVLDCGLRGRLGRTYPYGQDPEILRSIFIQNAEGCLKVFAKCKAEWSNPERLMGLASSECKEELKGLKFHWCMDRELFGVFVALFLGKRGEARAFLKDHLSGPLPHCREEVKAYLAASTREQAEVGDPGKFSKSWVL